MVFGKAKKLYEKLSDSVDYLKKTTIPGIKLRAEALESKVDGLEEHLRAKVDRSTTAIRNEVVKITDDFWSRFTAKTDEVIGELDCMIIKARSDAREFQYNSASELRRSVNQKLKATTTDLEERTLETVNQYLADFQFVTETNGKPRPWEIAREIQTNLKNMSYGRAIMLLTNVYRILSKEPSGQLNTKSRQGTQLRVGYWMELSDLDFISQPGKAKGVDYYTLSAEEKLTILVDTIGANLENQREHKSSIEIKLESQYHIQGKNYFGLIGIGMAPGCGGHNPMLSSVLEHPEEFRYDLLSQLFAIEAGKNLDKFNKANAYRKNTGTEYLDNIGRGINLLLNKPMSEAGRIQFENFCDKVFRAYPVVASYVNIQSHNNTNSVGK
jgi:hypothetical protein